MVVQLRTRKLNQHLTYPTRNFVDLNGSEKLEVLSQIGEELKGDYRKYLGRNEDSTTVQLTLNRDKRFAIGFKPFFNDKIESGDSVVTFQFSSKSEFKNLCVGHWIDEGKTIKLKLYWAKVTFLIL